MRLEAELTFAGAAARAAARIACAQWARLLARSAGVIFAALGAVWLALRLGGVRDELWWAVALAAVWPAALGAWAWRRRPRPFDALAAWDRSAGQRETFASAWFFEKTGTAQDGALLHLELAREQLEARAPRLRADLPVRAGSRGWWLAVLFFIFVFSGWLRPPIPMEERALSDPARRQAGEVSRELLASAAAIEPLKSLSLDEKERLQQLKAELSKTLEKMDRAATPRALLEQLERNAFASEKLADALRTEDVGALSSSFLTELEENADTADLGNALRSQNLGDIAARAQGLRDKLAEQHPTLEEKKRLEEALKRALAAASAQDRQSKVGAALAGAQQQLASGNAGAAGQHFGQLAQHFQRQAQRQLTQKQLRALAQSFRGAGQRVLGGSQNLQRLPPSAPAGTMPLLTPAPPGSMQSGRLTGLTGAPVPGGRPAGLPIPGQTAGARPGSAGRFPVPGAGQNPGGAPAPMPGATAGPPGGGFPIPGVGGGGKVGGTQAGHGTAPLGAAPTKLLTSKKTGVVAADASNEGESETRAIEGQAHRESSAREQQRLAITFIKAEEAALADESLPASRRDQVLRYFTALRQQFEP